MNCKTSHEFSWLGCDHEFEASKAEGNNPQTQYFVNLINNTGFLNTMTKSSGKF